MQDPTFANLLKFVWARRSHNTATGKLLDHPNPSPADLARAFPLAPPNYTALAKPAGERTSTAAVDQPAHTFILPAADIVTQPTQGSDPNIAR